MKLLVVASVFVLCFFGSTAGLQCYQCKDENPYSKCEDIIVKTCEPESVYCATAEKSGESDVRKGCVPKGYDVCKVGEKVIIGTDPSGKNISLLCCEGDLCNSSKKLTYNNALFYAISLSCVFSLVEFLFN